MGAHHDAIQGAVVLGIAVVSALLYGAFDALIGMTVHDSFLLFVWCKAIMCHIFFSYSVVAFWNFL